VSVRPGARWPRSPGDRAGARGPMARSPVTRSPATGPGPGAGGPEFSDQEPGGAEFSDPGPGAGAALGAAGNGSRWVGMDGVADGPASPTAGR
jgi:hypothetical protein